MGGTKTIDTHFWLMYNTSYPDNIDSLTARTAGPVRPRVRHDLNQVYPRRDKGQTHSSQETMTSLRISRGQVVRVDTHGDTSR